MLLKILPLLEVIVAVLSLFSEYFTVTTLQLICTNMQDQSHWFKPLVFFGHF